MNCDTRILTSKDVSENIQEGFFKNSLNTKTLVKLSSIVSESDRLKARNFAVLLIEVDGEMFRTNNGLGQLVPEGTTLVRDSKSQLVGLPMVAGG